MFQTDFVEIKAGGFEEAIFEIVEVKEDVHLIQLGLGIADSKVQSLSAEDLQTGQRGQCSPQQEALFLTIAASGLTGRTQGIEEGTRSQVFLQVTPFIV